MGKAARYRYSQWTERTYGDTKLVEELLHNTVLARCDSVEVEALHVDVPDRKVLDYLVGKITKLRSRPYGQ